MYQLAYFTLTDQPLAVVLNHDIKVVQILYDQPADSEQQRVYLSLTGQKSVCYSVSVRVLASTSTIRVYSEC